MSELNHLKKLNAMTLIELKKIIDANVNDPYTESAKLQVVVTLNEPALGARACTKVNWVGMGIDWEQNQFRIETTDQITRKGKALTDVMPVVCKPYDGRNYYFCKRCENKIGKFDKFCRECGQKLK